MHMSTKIVLFVVTALWSSLEVTATPLLLKDGFNSGVLESRYNRDETATTSDDFDGQVSWIDMNSQDGVEKGADANGIPYIRTFIEYFLDKRGSDRTTIFYTAVPDDNDLNLVDDLVCAIGRGVLYSDVFPRAGIETALDWRHTYRGSKAFALGANGKKAYVLLNPENGRTIFSPPSKNPRDYDPEHGNQATIGETWRYAELPALMRNTNIDQIISFWWTEDHRNILTHIEWDINEDRAIYPRNYLPDIRMDAVPIRLPERGPMKRSTMY